MEEEALNVKDEIKQPQVMTKDENVVDKFTEEEIDSMTKISESKNAIVYDSGAINGIFTRYD